MATMKLKVYRARTMAEALAEVKRDLGSEAVILHTRQSKAGGFWGIGAKTIYEVTATNDRSVAGPRRSPRPTRSIASPQRRTLSPVQTPEKQEANTLHGALAARAYGVRDESMAVGQPRPQQPRPQQDRSTPASQQPVRPEPAPRSNARPVESGTDARVLRVRSPKGTSTEAPSLRSELTSLKKMMSQVLRAQQGSAVPGAESDALFEAYTSLCDGGAPHEIADELIGNARDELSSTELRDAGLVRREVRRQIQSRLRVADNAPPPAKQDGQRPRVLAMIGPTGVGKTTTIAKLAACYKLRHNRRVGLITSDTYRIAAVEQLRTYAEIISIPLKVVMAPGEMQAAIASLADRDVILIDTAGRSPTDAPRLDELKTGLAQARPDETHLVLAAASAPPIVERIVSAFGDLGHNRVIVTKTDEAIGMGGLLAISDLCKAPISYTTFGQEVPDDIRSATRDGLAKLVLPDPPARPIPEERAVAVGGAA